MLGFLPVDLDFAKAAKVVFAFDTETVISQDLAGLNIMTGRRQNASGTKRIIKTFRK